VKFVPSVKIGIHTVHRVCIWNITIQSVHYPVMQGASTGATPTSVFPLHLHLGCAVKGRAPSIPELGCGGLMT